MARRPSFSPSDARLIAKALRIPIGSGPREFPPWEFFAGLNVELEHGTRYPQTNITNDDPVLTAKIAWAHLKEDRGYYTKLLRVFPDDRIDAARAAAFWSAVQVRMRKNPTDSAFARCVRDVKAHGGARSPEGVCAAAGRRKYGDAKFAAMAQVGKRRAARSR